MTESVRHEAGQRSRRQNPQTLQTAKNKPLYGFPAAADLAPIQKAPTGAGFDCHVALLYVIAAFAEFLAPYETRHDFKGFVYAPPAKIHFFDEDGFVGPFVYGLEGGRDESYQRVFVEIKEERYPWRLFVRGDSYEFWGLFETDLHLFGVGEEGQIFLFGTDRLGRDLLRA